MKIRPKRHLYIELPHEVKNKSQTLIFQRRRYGVLKGLDWITLTPLFVSTLENNCTLKFK